METPQHRAAFGPAYMPTYNPMASVLDQQVQLWMLVLAALVALGAGLGVGYMLGKRRR